MILEGAFSKRAENLFPFVQKTDGNMFGQGGDRLKKKKKKTGDEAG